MLGGGMSFVEVVRSFVLPLLGLALLFAALFGLLGGIMARALAASRELVEVRHYDYGPQTLFALSSFVMGWATVWFLRERRDVGGATLWIAASSSWVVAIVAGFGLAFLLAGVRPLDPMWELPCLCLLSAAAAGVLRTVYAE